MLQVSEAVYLFTELFKQKIKFYFCDVKYGK